LGNIIKVFFLALVVACNGSKFHNGRSNTGTSKNGEGKANPEANSADINESNSSFIDSYVEPEDITGTYLTCVSDSSTPDIVCDMNMSDTEKSSFAADVDRVEIEYSESIQVAEHRFEDDSSKLVVSIHEGKDSSDVRSMNVHFKPDSKLWPRSFTGIEIHRRRSGRESAFEIDFSTKAGIRVERHEESGFELKISSWRYSPGERSNIRDEGEFFNLLNGKIGGSTVNYTKLIDYCIGSPFAPNLRTRDLVFNNPHQIKIEFLNNTLSSFTCENDQQDCYISLKWIANVGNIPNQANKLFGAPMHWRVIRQSDETVTIRDENSNHSVILSREQLQDDSLVLQIMPTAAKLYFDIDEITTASAFFDLPTSKEINKDELCKSDLEVEAHNLRAKFKAIKIRVQKN